MLSLSPDSLWQTNSPFSHAFSIFPVVYVEQMNILHYYVTSLEMKRFKARENHLRKMVLASCEALTDYAFDHPIVKKDCETVAKDDAATMAPFKITPKENDSPKRHKRRPPTWKYFDKTFVYSPEKTHPSILLSDDHYTSLAVKQMLSLAEGIIREKYTSEFQLQELVNGYFRQDIYRGNEYIIDAVYNNTDQVISERVSFVHPFAQNILVQPSKNIVQETVNLIVPVSNSNKKCNHFINTFIRKSVENYEDARLILVVYKRADYEKIFKKVKQLKKQFQGAKITVIRGKGRFSRAKALHQGMSILKNSDLAFFCDVDLLIDNQFYNRCRRNTVRGKQVYLPTVIKFYSPKFGGPTKYVYPLYRQLGHWAYYSYGSVCIYKSDYITVGGLNIRMRGWGGEDMDFFKRIKQKGLNMFRAPDTGLSHQWHERDCSSKSVRRDMRSECLFSKFEALGDKRNLAKFIFNFTTKHPEI